MPPRAAPAPRRRPHGAAGQPRRSRVSAAPGGRPLHLSAARPRPGAAARPPASPSAPTPAPGGSPPSLFLLLLPRGTKARRGPAPLRGGVLGAGGCPEVAPSVRGRQCGVAAVGRVPAYPAPLGLRHLDALVPCASLVTQLLHFVTLLVFWKPSSELSPVSQSCCLAAGTEAQAGMHNPRYSTWDSLTHSGPQHALPRPPRMTEGSQWL